MAELNLGCTGLRSVPSAALLLRDRCHSSVGAGVHLGQTSLSKKGEQERGEWELPTQGNNSTCAQWSPGAKTIDLKIKGYVLHLNSVVYKKSKLMN